MFGNDDGRQDNGKDQDRTSDGKFGHKKNKPKQSPFKPKVKKKSSVNDPLFSFTINNPFKKILQWLDYLRKHHTTTFDFKIKVPLIALPIFLFVIIGLFQGFFSLGQYAKKQEIEALPTPTPIVIIEPTTTPVPVRGSYLGVVQSTYYIPPVTIPPAIESSTSAQPAKETLTTNRYILLDADNKVIFLSIASGVYMDRYLGRRVLITGLYDQPRQSLRVASSTDIEIIR